MVNVGLLILRVTLGTLMAGHGAQKLFGKFGGYGVQGTAGFVESLGLRPGRPWAVAAGASEFGGGVLTLLGLLNPLGPISIIGSMLMATFKVHWSKPIWVTSGGAELPVLNIAAATTLAVSGSDTYSLDKVLGIRIPSWVSVLALTGAAAAVAVGVTSGTATPEPSTEEDAGDDLQAGDEASHPV